MSAYLLVVLPPTHSPAARGRHPDVGARDLWTAGGQPVRRVARSG